MFQLVIFSLYTILRIKHHFDGNRLLFFIKYYRRDILALRHENEVFERQLSESERPANRESVTSGTGNVPNLSSCQITDGGRDNWSHRGNMVDSKEESDQDGHF